MMKSSKYLMLMILFISCHNNEVSNDKAIILSLDKNITQPLNKNVFGHFLEKCNWDGESGADVIIDKENHTIRKDVIQLIDSLKVPIVRFPGGTDIDYYQWTELIDQSYDRENPERPVYDGRSGNVVSKNELGLDEFLELSENQNFNPLLVVNLGDAYFKKKSIQEAADYAASLVAYCNASIDADLPEKYLKWAKLRALNGRVEPYGVTYFQIGNEVWMFDKGIQQNELPIDREIIERYVDILDVYTDAMKSVDASIQIIVEGNATALVNPSIDKLGSKIDMLAYHHYEPWGMNFAVNQKGDTVSNISPEELYYAMVSVPNFDSISGQADFHQVNFNALLKTEKQIAVTEWNWNGWVTGGLKKSGLKDSKLAQGIGSTSMLHAIMRHSDKIEMANQSMLAGNSWGINSIRIDKESSQASIFPTGLATGLYAAHHGDRVVKNEIENQEFYDQPYTGVGILKSKPKVAYLDVVVSENDDQYFLHIINRDYLNKRNIRLLADSFEVMNEFEHHEINGAVYSDSKPENANLYSQKIEKSFNEDDYVLQLNPHSINVIILTKKR